MSQLYTFLTGPAFIVSLLVFFGGLIFRLMQYFRGLDWRLERVAYRPWMSMGMKGGLHSLFKWLLPWGTYGWRVRPFYTLFFFLLHFGALLVPLFLAGHNVILRQNLGFGLPAMPQILADLLTVFTIFGLLLISLRRLALPEVRLMTTWQDWLVLLLVALPFVTGITARMRLGHYDFWMICHIISGELLLILAPFTKLSHISLYFASRWQIGADFSIKRGGHRRGPCFPW